MSKIAKVLAAGLVLASAGVAADAATGGGHGKSEGGGFWGWGGSHGKGHGGTQRLKRLDADKDGFVSKDEFLSRRKEVFADLDKDKNGSIDPAELRAPMDERDDIRSKRMIKRLDANGDGKVTKDEFVAGPKARFGERDLNSDGKLSDDERHGRRGGMWGWGKGGERRKEQTLDNVIASADAKFKELDTDGNGSLDAAELGTAAGLRADNMVKRMMHRVDKNNDGRISVDEFVAKAEKRFSSLDLDNDGKIGPPDLSPSEQKAWGSKE